ncbi:hypothetical protein DMN91_007127 [Ooceraea biroi]|uniref:Nucleolar protein 14-like protein n=1 Tax=Ooceraea biroi TaxID=2015173 RepID=A0A026WMA3_OOCBI|nr:nucleolar protein 14 homolog [Ooceraea biroi]XP_026827080.1 nucleolar protein 14 homolog [Ooceraea biroi]XP_026827081.1 nucleolar protein 14 homolog [Ooceraea biroi]EZA57140.1 Nucleolar protein 14-like protein [Ooceraea biroi]RLU20517.1 hypothetical protein DMN91_007127 [Ooceraea biroi]
MVKAKKRNMSEFAQRKRAQNSKKQLNPFEIHINKQKQKILGQKNKHDRGLPGVSRARAIDKRKQSLLQEYKLKNKDNIFLDKRIGERNSAMSAEDRAMARFARERIKAHRKKGIYNLNDDETLTHRGQTLEEIEKFDDPRSDEESDDGDASGKLDRNFVEEAHFGGGVLSQSDATLSRKDVINQLIAESKKRKAEQQKIREQTIDLTEKLDSEWRDFVSVVSVCKKTDEDTGKTTKADDYDVAVRQLKFEARGNPSEKLKSEEQIVQEEKERLEALEADRLARMKGFVSDASNQCKHRSADDLDDGFLVEAIGEDDNDNDINNVATGTDNNEKSSDDDDDDDDDDDGDDNADDADNDDNLESSLEERSMKDTETKKDDGTDKERTYFESSSVEDKSATTLINSDQHLETENSDCEASEDDLSDLRVSEESSEDENKTVDKHVTFASNLTKCSKQANQSSQNCLKSILKQSNSDARVQNSSKEDRKDEILSDLLKRKDIMEAARNELPYTYNVPGRFEELEKLLKNHDVQCQSLIIDRIIKCNHWTLNGKNKEKLSDLFVYLLQYINNCAYADNTRDLVECFQVFDRLCPYLYDLAYMDPGKAVEYVQEIIKEKHEHFAKNKKRYPGMDTLILFKLVSLLFPTSDFKHPVVTPCLVFMSQILLRSHLKRVRTDIAKGLFICTLILEYTVLSKRFAPSAINFLRGIIYTAITTDVIKKTVPPFKAACKVLVTEGTDVEIDTNGARMFASDLVDDEINDEFRIRAVLTAVNLIKDFKNQLQELEAVHSIFEPVVQLLSSCKFKNYPSNVRRRIREVRKELALLRNKKLEYIVLEKKRPKPLRMYEPKIVTVYEGKQHKPMSKKKAERAKLLHKYKREYKGAVREIKKDRNFLFKVQIAQQIKSDAERKRKVNLIFGEAATQQHEFKKMKRKK